MAFVRVSGYNQTDLNNAMFGIMDNRVEMYAMHNRNAPSGHEWKYLYFKFGKPYAWALITTANADNDEVWTGGGACIHEAFRWNAGSGNDRIEDNPTIILLKDVKENDIYGRLNNGSTMAVMRIIACPYDDGVDVIPSDTGGFYIGPDEGEIKQLISAQYRYGSNNKGWYNSGTPVIVESSTP